MGLYIPQDRATVHLQLRSSRPADARAAWASMVAFARERTASRVG